MVNLEPQTLADVFGVQPRQRTHGTSLRPLVEGTGSSVRDWALGGVWGNWVQVTDGHRKYARGPVGGNRPLSMWSNRWSTMPLHMAGFGDLPLPDERAELAFMPGSRVPVIRQAFGPDARLPYWAAGRSLPHHLYDVEVDPDEAENRAGEAKVERDMLDLLRAALDEVEAPPDQYVRLGLS